MNAVGRGVVLEKKWKTLLRSGGNPAALLKECMRKANVFLEFLNVLPRFKTVACTKIQ